MHSRDPDELIADLYTRDGPSLLCYREPLTGRLPALTGCSRAFTRRPR
jgi:hypothetical protein